MHVLCTGSSSDSDHLFLRSITCPTSPRSIRSTLFDRADKDEAIYVLLRVQETNLNLNKGFYDMNCPLSLATTLLRRFLKLLHAILMASTLRTLYHTASISLWNMFKLLEMSVTFLMGFFLTLRMLMAISPSRRCGRCRPWGWPQPDRLDLVACLVGDVPGCVAGLREGLDGCTILVDVGQTYVVAGDGVHCETKIAVRSYLGAPEATGHRRLSTIESRNASRNSLFPFSCQS
jgi:hypothetical protein